MHIVIQPKKQRICGALLSSSIGESPGYATRCVGKIMHFFKKCCEAISVFFIFFTVMCHARQRPTKTTKKRPKRPKNDHGSRPSKITKKKTPIAPQHFPRKKPKKSGIFFRGRPADRLASREEIPSNFMFFSILSPMIARRG